MSQPALYTIQWDDSMGVSMKTKIQVIVAALIIIGAGYWGYVSTRSYHYSGSNIMFPVGGGHAVVRNTSDQPLEIEMRSGERVASFRISSPELGLSQASKRQGTGREAFHNVIFDIPPGQTRVEVISGSDVRMIARGDTRIEATVVPISANSVRWILILSGGVIVWALYYMSSATGHRWIGALRGKPAANSTQLKQTPT
jgi:hypothetical protein